jgi:hypothetical protein
VETALVSGGRLTLKDVTQDRGFDVRPNSKPLIRNSSRRLFTNFLWCSARKGVVVKRRVEPRWVAGATTSCRVPATPLSAKILDISRAGCPAQALRDDVAAKGAAIVLQLSPFLAAAGHIAWLRGRDFGL